MINQTTTDCRRLKAYFKLSTFRLLEVHIPKIRQSRLRLLNAIVLVLKNLSQRFFHKHLITYHSGQPASALLYPRERIKATSK